MDYEALVVDAFAQLGLHARVLVDASDHGADLALDIDGMHLAIQTKRFALVDDAVAERVLREPAQPADTILVVADRVTESARRVLTAGRTGFYDLRGRLALRADGIVIDAEIEPLRDRPQRADALSGKAGMEVATALLMRPDRGIAVRELARHLGRSASTVSEVLSALRRAELVNAENSVPDSRLFWEVAERWAAPRVYLAQPPPPGDVTLTQALRLGLTDVQHGTKGWALTDSAAAAAYGAPVAFRSGQMLDFYVPDQAIQSRATTLLGAVGNPSLARATVRIAPVPAIVRHRVDLDANPLEWPLAHPVFVALDLAQDVGRGREILDGWSPDGWARVW